MTQITPRYASAPGRYNVIREARRTPARSPRKLITNAVVALLAGPASSAGAAGTLDTTELNNSLKTSLEAGRNAGKDLTCTATNVFFASDFMKFVFGGILLVTLITIGAAWFTQSRGGATPSRLFWVIVVGMAGIALIGTLVSNFMAC